MLDPTDLFRRLLGRPHPDPVYVLGNQKSGTTVIAALLAASAGRKATLDILYRLENARVWEDFLAGDAGLDRVMRESPRDFCNGVIKDPDFTFRYPHIRELIPNARFAFVVRDPRDNVRSILNRLRLPGTVMDRNDPEVVEAFEANTGWRHVLDGRLPPTLRPTIVRTLAARWQTAAEVYLAAPGDFELLRYEDFRKDKSGTISELARALGLPGGRDVSHLVDRQFQPRGDNSSSWEDYFGEENLAGIVSEAAEGMSELGYA